MIPLTEIANYMKATVCVNHSIYAGHIGLNAEWDMLGGATQMLGGSLIQVAIINCSTGNVVFSNKTVFAYPNTVTANSAHYTAVPALPAGYYAPRVYGVGAVKHQLVAWYFSAAVSNSGQTLWQNNGDCIYIG